MTSSSYSLMLALGLGIGVAAACGPSPNVNNPDGAGAATPSASATTDTGPTETPSATASAGGAGGAGGAASGGGSAAGGAGAGGGASTPATPSAMVASADAANGGKLFEQEHCSGCHGTKAKPPGKFPNLFKLDWSDKRIEGAFGIVKKGKSPMPGYGDKLDDKAIADIVAFLKTK